MQHKDIDLKPLLYPSKSSKIQLFAVQKLLSLKFYTNLI